jgi:hypothetical protein
MYLKDLTLSRPDKLGNEVIQVLWSAEDFKVYRTRAGVFVHLSDCCRTAKAQTEQFNQLHPRLCQLRFLTSCMDNIGARLRRTITGDVERSNFFHQETARILVQALHNHCGHARTMLDFVTEMALERVTNENRVRYLAACVSIALFCALGIGSLRLLGGYPSQADAYALAGVCGALGAVFSIAISVESLKLLPSRHSTMNYVMGALRVLTGLMGGGVLVLLLKSGLTGQFGKVLLDASNGSPLWEQVAMLGFFAGFAERLVPKMLSGAADELAVYRPADKIRTPETGNRVSEADAHR